MVFHMLIPHFPNCVDLREKKARYTEERSLINLACRTLAVRRVAALSANFRPVSCEIPDRDFEIDGGPFQALSAADDTKAALDRKIETKGGIACP